MDKLAKMHAVNTVVSVVTACIMLYYASREVKAVAISSIGGGAYGVNLISQPKFQKRSSPSVRFGRFTINAGFRYLYRSLNCINCWAD